MSDAATERKRQPARRNHSIYRVHFGLEKSEEEAKPLPPMDRLDVQAYGLQVAGHMTTHNQKYLGVLQCSNGTILKPLIKEAQQREVDFYTRIYSSEHPKLVELRALTARYHGVRQFTYNGFQQDYIVLEDLAGKMLEPCIMDVKIGKRTWDPLATEEKIASEQSKYALSKQQFGFCIPGYQVHRLSSGQLLKYGKEHGKKLHGNQVRAAIKSYLNGSAAAPVCRALLLQFLSGLWRLQRWAARAGPPRLYSASLLLVYDAHRLREAREEPPSYLARRNSAHSSSPAGSPFSGQLSAAGPVYKKVNAVPITPMASSHDQPPISSSPWHEALEKLNHNHSFEHNYEDKLAKIKMNYRALLDQLCTDNPTNSPWGTVRVIDFAHAFFDEEDEETVDQNFKEGVDNFVAIFESFLRETDDQVLL